MGGVTSDPDVATTVWERASTTGRLRRGIAVIIARTDQIPMWNGKPAPAGTYRITSVRGKRVFARNSRTREVIQFSEKAGGNPDE